MVPAVYRRRLEDDHDADYLPRAAKSRSAVDVAQPPALPSVVGRSAGNTSLQPGQAFGESAQVRAIVTKQGTLVVAMPHQFFDTTDSGRKIRLRERNVPGVPPRKIDDWWAGGERGVARILTAPEFQSGGEDRGLPALPPVGTDYSVSQPSNRARRRSFWLEALITVALLITAGLTYLLESHGDPVTAAQLLPALIGLAGLMIFGVAAMAIIRGAVTS